MLGLEARLVVSDEDVARLEGALLEHVLEERGEAFFAAFLLLLTAALLREQLNVSIAFG